GPAGRGLCGRMGWAAWEHSVERNEIDFADHDAQPPCDRCERDSKRAGTCARTRDLSSVALGFGENGSGIVAMLSL
ncbi:MAG: hypothetical protein AAF220_04715, partial [Pseudomonadota bacterium]